MTGFIAALFKVQTGVITSRGGQEVRMMQYFALLRCAEPPTTTIFIHVIMIFYSFLPIFFKFKIDGFAFERQVCQYEFAGRVSACLNFVGKHPSNNTWEYRRRGAGHDDQASAMQEASHDTV